MESWFDDIQEDLLKEDLEKYSETAVDYFMNPRNIGKLEDFDCSAGATGPCGDSMTIWIKVADDVISDISFITDGCGPSIASASMVTVLAKGKTLEDALRIGQWDVINALGGMPEEKEHCCLLAATALRKAIENCSASKE
jgi:nitrogen fixation NifU-like protein